MDISFTNVLEGAREYFRGLPAASSSTGSPAAQIPHRENDGSVHSEQHSAVPYWDQQNEGQGTNLTNRDVMNPAQPSRSLQNNASSSTNYHYEKNQNYNNYPAASQVSHLYQSHIPSSSSYYEIQTPQQQQQQQQQPQQQKASYVNSSMPQSTHQQTDSSNSSRTYNYPTQQNHPVQQHSYSNYSQNSASSSSHQQDTQYNYKLYNQQATRPSQSYQANYYQAAPIQQQQQQPQQQQQQQQQHQHQQRSTHQLPVVPTNIYHSRSTTKPIQHQPVISNASNYQNKIIHNLQVNTNQNDQRMQMQNGVSYSDQYKYYQNTPKYTHSSYNTTTTTTYSNQYSNSSRQSYVDSRASMPRQHQPQPQPQQSKYVSHAEVKPAAINNSQKLMAISKQKRESPLDLSVKTVKTSADSTLAEFDDRNYRAAPNRYEMMMQQYQSVRAPKVDFLPNFNMPSNTLREDARKTNKNYYNYPLTTSNATPVREALPRIDFPSLGKNISTDLQRKRMQEHVPSSIPEKMPKVDTWRQNIDKQIEQRLSSYTKSRLEQDPNKTTKGVNGNSQLPQNKVTTYNEMQQRFSSSNNETQMSNYKVHSNSYQYPPYPYNQAQSYQHPIKSKIPPTNPNKQTTANKKVLSLLRNSLQIKGAQKKMEQELIRQNYREIQQPSTDVLAPLQPKPGIVGRRNVSPFTAASLERNSNTPPAYKLHIPKAIDSVIFSDGEKDQQDHQASMGQPTDLDGLAAFLAARIRTKAELKQVGPSEQTSNNNTFATITHSPPKLKKESSGSTTPKKLFGRSEIPEITPNINKLNKRAEIGGIRSSSETSVFDFPDSDTEAEMPVLERQSLVEMRKDRKTIPTQFTCKSEDQENTRPASPFDLLFSQTCDTFMEQLKTGFGKKRGRRKKSKREDGTELESNEVSPIKVKSEDIVEKTIAIEPLENIKIKVEVEELPSNPLNDDNKSEIKLHKDKSDSDSDTPLVKIVSKNKVKSKVVVKEEPQELKKDPREVSSDSEVDGISKNIRKNKDIKTEIFDLTQTLPLAVCKPGKKPAFGDGSDFHPGWEEELYKYKKALRMPRMLIQVTRPPNTQRLSTSLPDLDPCPVSPAHSTATDTDFKRKLSFKTESIDSDMDSNCSYNFSMLKTNYDSEEGSSSVKSLNTKYTILDKLLERYGSKKRKRIKKTEEGGPKIIPKSENPLQLLPTPSLEVEKDAVVNSQSVLLGFRKKTVNNFKDAFINNSNKIVGVNEFTTVVLKSRTRTETRVLKEKATIREVFGEDRPASAPPVTCLDEIKPDDINDGTKQKGKENLHKKTNEKLSKLTRDLNDALIKVLETKKIKTEITSVDIKKEEDIKTEAVEGEVVKKRSKLRSIRRKFSSGFDYIRKKKKQIKKEDVENEVAVKPKRRGAPAKANPESVQDIQKEIKVWVLNKGVGETHLHRASRSGFTDITAYCLENMSCNPTPKDNAGYTPLHEACSKGHLDIARLLLQYGAHVSESAQGGIRPLHEAAENGFVEIVRLLLSYGADPTLATYSGITPLQLAVDDKTVSLLQYHLDDIQGKSKIPWTFKGPADIFDETDVGFNPLSDVPEADGLPEEVDIEMEVSEQLLPNLYTLPGSDTDRWVLLQDLSNILKIKSKETLLRQLNVMASTANKSDIVKELKMTDFLEQARCCQFLNANEKLNTRSSKIFLVKYTEKVKRLLNIEKVIIDVR